MKTDDDDEEVMDYTI